MIAAHSDLYDQAYRYRRLLMASLTDPDEFIANHETLARMTIERSESEACAAIGAHIATTLAHAYPQAGRPA
jgi:DNA-binding GntR family transcriptional regulator